MRIAIKISQTFGQRTLCVGGLLVSLSALLSAGCSQPDGAKGASSSQENPRRTSQELVDQRQLGGNEPSIAIDPTNTQNIAMAQYTTVLLSTDGGNTFPTTVNVTLPAGFNLNRGGDPVLSYDRQGNLFLSFLATHAASLRLDVFLQPINHATGTAIGTAINVSNLAGFGAAAGSNNDKEWLAIDRFPGSPFRDRMYMVWTDFGGANVTVLASFSTDGGATWSPGQVLTVPAEGFPWPPHVAVAPNGDVYAAYHGATNSEIILVRSPFDSPTNSGGNFDLTTKTSVFPANAANLTFNNPPNLDRNRSWTQGSQQPFILPDPTNGNRVLVLASDDPTDANNGVGFDDAAVFTVTTNNRGVNWTAPTQVDSGPGNSHQLFPTGAFDLNSQCLSVMYYDSRAGAVNAGGNFLLDVFVRTSPDSGATWGPEVQINDNPFDPDMLATDRFPPSQTFRVGEYNGLLQARGAVWTGNDPLGPVGAQAQRILFDYSDGIAPTFTAVPAAVNSPTCAVPSIGTATANDNQCGIGGVVVTNNAPARFAPGANTVTWTATDAADNAAQAPQTVTVTDTTPPVFVSATLPPVVERRCDYGASPVTIPVPAATDDCDGTVMNVSGTITSSSNAAVPVGTPLVGGTVALPPGVYVVTWVATDNNGNHSASKTQTVTVQPTIQASNAFYVRDRAAVRNTNGTPAAVLNSGKGVTSIGGDNATVGAIVAGGNVTVGWNGFVYGDIRAVGSIQVNDPSKHFGNNITVSSVALPAPPTLPAFPPPTGGDKWVNPGTDLSLPPGSYGQIGVNGNPNPNNAAIVRFSAGDYFFTNLYFNSAGLVVVAQPGTRIFVSGNVTFNTSIVTSVGSSTLAPVMLGVSGSGALALYAPFTGSVVAPQRDLVVGTANGMTFKGSFYAKSIDVTPASVLVCDSSVVAPTPPTCSNGALDPGETGVDCGGPQCNKCASGGTCSVGNDCASQVCTTGICQAPSCADGVQNGTETGLDCGGTCAACPVACNAFTYQAESMFHSTGNAWWQGGWNIYTNGYISTTHNFSAGANVINVSAFGQQFAGVLPHMTVRVGGALINPTAGVNVGTSGFNPYQFTFNAAGGSQEVRVAFDNDANGPSGDRNLIVRTVAVSCP